MFVAPTRVSKNVCGPYKGWSKCSQPRYERIEPEPWKLAHSSVLFHKDNTPPPNTNTPPPNPKSKLSPWQQLTTVADHLPQSPNMTPIVSKSPGVLHPVSHYGYIRAKHILLPKDWHSQTWGSSLLERTLPLTMALWLHTAEADINMPGKALFRAGVTAMQREASQHCSDCGSSECVQHGYAEKQLVNNFLGHTLCRVAANIFF